MAADTGVRNGYTELIAQLRHLKTGMLVLGLVANAERGLAILSDRLMDLLSL